MATVTGIMNDFGMHTLTGFAPEIVFTPSGPATSGSTVFATKPVVVVPASNGTFTVELAPTIGMFPDAWYTVTLRWLDPAGNYMSADFISWILRVPFEGGVITDLLETPSNPAYVWVDVTPPVNMTPGSWWLNPATGDLYEWSN